MQVSQVQDHCTHAVIGGKQSIEFGISNSAEFFSILSSTLYKDQILAVVREVLCNAWDAHIEAGCTDRPVQVTLERDKFVIRDLGKGIHHDDMGLIYATYGNSTKKNDGTQTGGFGLGCKAPFAYTDHFEVTSCHAGVKTIYNLSKSSAQAMGKPGITQIASFPTEDSGLTVSIQIKSVDYVRFHELVTRIVRNGDMNMTLNGKQLDTIGFDVSKGNYLIFQAQRVLDTVTPIMVRYGNVVYPIDITKEIGAKFTQITSHLNDLRSRAGGYQMLFQAPAHSISVTPSREALSMQEHTVNTLNKLFSDFLDTLKTTFPTVCLKYAEEITQKAVTALRIDELLVRDDRLPNLHGKEELSSISDLGTMASVFMRHNYPQGLDYRKADITRRLQLMAQQKLLDQGKVQTFLLAMKDVKHSARHSANHWGSRYEKSSWLQRRVVAPLLNKLGKAGLDTKKLYLCDREDLNCPGNSSDKVPPLVSATRVSPVNLLTTLPYLRNIIVITSRRNDLVNRVYQHEAFKGLGNYHGFLVYNVGRKAGEMEAARKFFAEQAMRVIDLTTSMEQERDTPKPRAPRTPTKKGLACLSSIKVTCGINTHRARNEDAVRIDNPEFVIHLSIRQEHTKYSLENWDQKSSYQLVELFGAKGGVTISSAAQEKWIAKGAKDFNEYVREQVCGYILNNPRIKEYWAFAPTQVYGQVGHKRGLVDLLFSNPSLMKEFSLVNNLTDQDRVYLSLWKQLRLQNNIYQPKKEIAQVDTWLGSIPLDTTVHKLIAKLGNPLVHLLDTSTLVDLLNEKSNPLQAEKVLKILISVLNS